MQAINQPDWNWKRTTAGFLAGQGISLFGSQIVQMAMIWHMTLETSSGIWITALTLAAFLPQMIISLLGGVWADRYNRKKLIIISDTIIAITTLLLACYLLAGNTGATALQVIILAAAIRSLGSGVQTPAVQAMLPQFVPEASLARVNGYNSTIQSVVQFASPVAAGALMALGPIHNILLIDVATAIIGIGILAVLRIPPHQQPGKPETTSILAEMKQGLRFAWNHPFLRKLLTTYGIFIFLSVPSGFLTALMIQRTFGDQVWLLTVNETLGFAGATLGGLLLGITGGFRNRNKTFFAGIILYGIASLAVGFTTVFRLFAALMFIIGLSIPAAQTAVFTLIQEKVEPAMLGRVFSLVNVLFSGFMPLGMALFGPLADFVRIQTMVVACAILIIMLSLNMVLARGYYQAGESTAPVEAAEGEGQSC